MISKVIAWASTRDEALSRLKRALSEYVIAGVETNILLLKSILEHPVFQKGIHTTKFLDMYMHEITYSMREWERIHALALAVVSLRSVNGFQSMIPRIPVSSEHGSHRFRAIRRRAWVYWSMLRSRVGRRSRTR